MPAAHATHRHRTIAAIGAVRPHARGSRQAALGAESGVARFSLALAVWAFVGSFANAAKPPPPNVVVIIADDMGYGDLGSHGNRILRTPNLDRLAAESLELTNFHVSPVCAPTRASLLTGRYNYRTGVTDTFQGRALMRPDEVTLAEHLSACGYQTGIFGKWHLGDCHPMRPIDQGFRRALVHRGGGIGQPSDPPDGTSYFNPVLFEDGRPKKEQGYVSDVITDAAIRFIDANRDGPFFLYLAFNAPHVPLEVPDRYYALYRDQDLSGYKTDPDVIARVYGMVTNIDDNLGRLLAKLDVPRLAENTIVVFLTDNGPQQARFNAALRGLKGTVYEGGIRVPFFIRWPSRIAPGKTDRLAAHVDVVPTLLEACACKPNTSNKLDGMSLWPFIAGRQTGQPKRTLFLQWHRGNVPQRYRGFAAVTDAWKLLRPDSGAAGDVTADSFELYRAAEDRGETRNVAHEHPEIVERLRREYDAWFDDVCQRGFDPPSIILGSDRENPTILTRQDWRREEPTAQGTGIGRWFVDFAQGGNYRFQIHFPSADAGQATLEIDGRHWQVPIAAGGASAVGPLRLASGRATIFAKRLASERPEGAFQVVVERLAE